MEIVTLEFIANPSSAEYNRNENNKDLFNQMVTAIEKEGGRELFEPYAHALNRAFIIDRVKLLNVLASQYPYREWMRLRVFSLAPEDVQLAAYTSATKEGMVDLSDYEIPRSAS